MEEAFDGSALHALPTSPLSTVEPFKTDTPRDRPKCPSYGGVRLIEVLKSIDFRQKEFQVELIVVGQALISIKMN